MGSEQKEKNRTEKRQDEPKKEIETERTNTERVTLTGRLTLLWDHPQMCHAQSGLNVPATTSASDRKRILSFRKACKEWIKIREKKGKTEKKYYVLFMIDSTVLWSTMITESSESLFRLRLCLDTPEATRYHYRFPRRERSLMLADPHITILSSIIINLRKIKHNKRRRKWKSRKVSSCNKR